MEQLLTIAALFQGLAAATTFIVFFCAMGRQPAAMLFSMPIDSLAGAGVVIADVWLNDEKAKMVVVDSLGEEFLNYVKDGMSLTVKEDGTVEVN